MTRLVHPDGSTVHLGYCTNVHPAEDLDGVLAQLARFAAPLRRRLSCERLGVGLWLAAPLARRLRTDARGVTRLRDTLARLRLEVVTFNGFPFSAFHAPVVKRAVYRPDWTEPERARYTLDLAWLLAALLPADVREGSLSTLPLGWRTGWGARKTAAARAALEGVHGELERLERATGRRVRLALEPEPGCAVETVAQALAALDGLDPAWVGLCLDACHLAVQFEEPAAVLAALEGAGVPVVKLQASAALRAERPAVPELRHFVEPRFLHQTRTPAREGLLGVDDLDEALAGGLPRAREWRVHFHVPVHLDGAHTTQPLLRELLARLLGGSRALTHHVELETYTWNVLPEGLRLAGEDPLVTGLARELWWLADELVGLGLAPASPPGGGVQPTRPALASPPGSGVAPTRPEAA